MAVGFYLLTLWQDSMRSVGVLHPCLSKMATTLSSNASAYTSLRMPTISRNFYLECYAFNQHWHSILTGLLDRRVLACFVTDSWVCNLKKNSFNLRISTRTLLVTFSILFWSDKVIGIRSFLLIFCNDSLV